ncbi:MAG: hypothetical protein ACLFO5_01320 [Opitutales bacterium]
MQTFDVPAPPPGELPAELDYDCEICCRPMVLTFREEMSEVIADVRGLED